MRYFVVCKQKRFDIRAEAKAHNARMDDTDAKADGRTDEADGRTLGGTERTGG